MKPRKFELTADDLAGISLVFFNRYPIKACGKSSLNRIKAALDNALNDRPRRRRGVPHVRYVIKQAIREAA